MRKLFVLLLATVLFSLFSISAFAFEADNNWKYFVVHPYTNTREYTERWYSPNYDDTWWDHLGAEGWSNIIGDGIKPVYTSGSDAVYFRKWVDWNGEDLWFRAWEGYAGECYINEQKVPSSYIHLSDYLKPGKNLVACSIWGGGGTMVWKNGGWTTINNRQAYFYGQFKTVSDNQLAWSNNWKDWFVTEKPVNSGTEARFYYCFDNPEQSYGCFENSAWPWSNEAGTAFRKTFYLENTENSYLLVGTNLLDSSLSNKDHLWCSVNGDQTNNVVSFSKNTHEKYNLKADISKMVKPGLNNITCWVSTYADPNSFPTGFKKFDLSFVQKDLDILGLKTSSVSIEDPTINILVNGSGSATVYAELFENGITLGAVEDSVDLNGKTEVLLTLETPKAHSEPYWRFFGSHMYGQINPSPEWYKLNYDDSSYVSRANNIEERWVTKISGTEPIGATGSDESYFRTWINWKGEDFSLNGWDGYFGECYINERKITDKKIQLKTYLKPGNNLIACMIKGTGWESNNLMTYFYGNINPIPDYTSGYSVKITAVSDYGVSKTKNYNLEFTKPISEFVPVDNPFMQSGGGGTEGSDTNSSGSVPIVPLAVGLTGAVAIGAGYLATRPGKKYGKPSLGPGERLKTFWDNTAKEEKYYNEVRVPEIRKRQAEIEAIIKGFEEKARKKKEQEELEKITERMAWLNKAMLAGNLRTVEVSKELRVLAGSPGIGVEASNKLLNESKKLAELTIEEIPIIENPFGNPGKDAALSKAYQLEQLVRSGKISPQEFADSIDGLALQYDLSYDTKMELQRMKESALISVGYRIDSQIFGFSRNSVGVLITVVKQKWIYNGNKRGMEQSIIVGNVVYVYYQKTDENPGEIGNPNGVSLYTVADSNIFIKSINDMWDWIIGKWTSLTYSPDTKTKDSYRALESLLGRPPEKDEIMEWMELDDAHAQALVGSNGGREGPINIMDIIQGIFIGLSVVVERNPGAVGKSAVKSSTEIGVKDSIMQSILSKYGKNVADLVAKSTTKGGRVLSKFEAQQLATRFDNLIKAGFTKEEINSVIDISQGVKMGGENTRFVGLRTEMETVDILNNHGFEVKRGIQIDTKVGRTDIDVIAIKDDRTYLIEVKTNSKADIEAYIKVGQTKEQAKLSFVNDILNKKAKQEAVDPSGVFVLRADGLPEDVVIMLNNHKVRTFEELL